MEEARPKRERKKIISLYKTVEKVNLSIEAESRSVTYGWGWKGRGEGGGVTEGMGKF